VVDELCRGISTVQMLQSLAEGLGDRSGGCPAGQPTVSIQVDVIEGLSPSDSIAMGVTARRVRVARELRGALKETR
jgi:hypothetical protein